MVASLTRAEPRTTSSVGMVIETRSGDSLSLKRASRSQVDRTMAPTWPRIVVSP